MIGFGNLAASMASGAAAGSAFPGIGTGIGALASLLGGLIASGDSPNEEAMKEVMDMIKQQLPNASKLAFTKDEINSLVKTMQSIYRGGANVAAGQIGSAIGESGMTPGQGFAEYYTQSLAPVIAEGENKAAGAVGWGEQAYSDNYNAAQDRISRLLGLLTQAASGQGSMTGWQKGISGFLQTGNLLATGYGNLAKGWRDWNYKPPTGNSNG